MRFDRTGLPTWPYERAARDGWSVANWIRERFTPTYPRFAVEVLDGDGNAVRAGQTRLKSVRATYADD